MYQFRAVSDSAVVPLVLVTLLSKRLLWERPQRGPGKRRGAARNAAAGGGHRAHSRLHVNGSWLAQHPSGAGRYASEMVKAIALLGGWTVVLHVPAGVRAELPPWMIDFGIEIRRSPFSGVLFEQICLPAATAGALLLNFSGSAPLLKRRQLVTMHDAAPFRCPAGLRRWEVMRRYLAYRWLGRVVEGLLTVSVFSAHELSDVLGVRVDRFMVAGGSADSLTAVPAVRPAALAWTGDEYLVVGTRAPHKNVRAAVRTLADSGRKVAVVGMDRDRRGHGKADRLDGRAMVTGWMTDAEMVWLYRHSRALVYPSAYQGFGLAPVEAQALGCPVVCSDAAALPEVCRDGALYFDAGDPQMLLAQLNRLEYEIDLADDLRYRGFVNAQRYSWSDSAQQVLAWSRRRHRRGALVC